ncbi:uncharacterized protein LOC120185712 [Hibiscus syriacus]|uniref:uncharacterized protein LOC120185712 n=1 Tax=Hibiscus syriacus TaxID=106335 RepID=UPI00192097D3|nr:uncharacterized protein LOC120185712 [Hibiscus syriacus]
MGVSDHHVSSLCCEVRILEGKNIELKSHGNLFIRYYLPAGNNKRIQLNTKIGQVSEESVKYLKQQTVVFELRRKKKLGKYVVLSRAEMPLEVVFESPNMEIDEYWLAMVSMNDGALETGLKPPSIRLSMKMEKNERKRRLKNHWEGCVIGPNQYKHNNHKKVLSLGKNEP